MTFGVHLSHLFMRTTSTHRTELESLPFLLFPATFFLLAQLIEGTTQNGVEGSPIEPLLLAVLQ